MIFKILSPLENLHFFTRPNVVAGPINLLVCISTIFGTRSLGGVSFKISFLDVLSIFKKNEINNACFFFPTKKTNNFYVFCVLIPDRVELRGVVNIATPTFGDQHVLFYKHRPLKNYS